VKPLLTLGNPTVAHFTAAWRRLASEGLCNGVGSADYRRMRREWTWARRPWAIEEWIRCHANTKPGGTRD
jgi:hypothetical protein